MANGQCPSNTNVGGGNAVVNVVIGTSVIQNVPATITAYNANKALRFRVVSQATPRPAVHDGSDHGQAQRTYADDATCRELHPAGPNSKVILTEFHVTIEKKSKGRQAARSGRRSTW